MWQTQTLDLPELLAKGVAADAREAAESLAAVADVPERLHIRVRAMQLELSEALLGAMAGSPDWAAAARVAAYPARELAEVVREADEVGTMNRDRTRLALLGIAQALEHIAEAPPDVPIGVALEWLLAHTGWTQKQLAGVLDVDERSVQRWTGDQTASPQMAARIRALHRIAVPLRYAMTARGVGQWLERPLAAFDGRAPIELLDDEQAVDELVHVATALRG